MLVDGRYRLERILGEGATGSVWVARDERRDIDVALKVLRPKHAATPAMLERFVMEAELSERMLSPHIVRVLARGTTSEGAPYIAYELLEGEDLAVRLGAGGRLALDATRAVVVHTCRALAENAFETIPTVDEHARAPLSSILPLRLRRRRLAARGGCLSSTPTQRRTAPLAAALDLRDDLFLNRSRDRRVVREVK